MTHRWRHSKQTLRLVNPSDSLDDSPPQDGSLRASVLPAPAYYEAFRDLRLIETSPLGTTDTLSFGATTPSSLNRSSTTNTNSMAYSHHYSSASTSSDPREPMMENPPNYGDSRNPVGPVTYQFSNLPGGGTLLLPPESAPNTRPVYHIRTTQNTFAPLSHRTVVHRGSSEQGEFIGEFEFGMSANDAYILLHKKALPLPQVLYKSQKPQGSVSYTVYGKWTWRWPRTPVPLFWNCIDRSEGWTCELEDKTRLAEYVPPHLSPSRGMTLPTLEVMPTGQKYFDDILFGAIILEQKNSLPSFTVINRAFCSKEMYNF
ncbi:hypothetical protein BDN72DRAFT_448732 [Pluteus cervinus]|uniref:Uncharacterized protein n=1 Tax=Pluteus cervinus TaxID=181527 RepID=A0ACD3BCT3_9AGAR|nr:hypothetical protein BDN72DRAFT_448732 [Pluteus cervinus]